MNIKLFSMPTYGPDPRVEPSWPAWNPCLTGQIGRWRVGSSRVRSGQEVLKSRGSGRIGSGNFTISRVGSGRVKRLSKSRGSGRVKSTHTSIFSRVGSDTYHNAPWPLNIIIQSIGPNWRERGFPVYLLKKANKYAASMSSLSSTKRVLCTDGIFDSRISSQDHGQPTLYTKQYHNNKHSPTIISKRVCFGAIYYDMKCMVIISLAIRQNVRHDLQHWSLITFPKEEKTSETKGNHLMDLLRDINSK